MAILGIIPARFHSTRLKEKMLREVKGKALIEWSYENAKRSKEVDRWIVATDDSKNS